MSHSVLSDTSASITNKACKPANKQTTISSYFGVQSNGPKRKRRNVAVLNTEIETAADIATCEARYIAVKKENETNHVQKGATSDARYVPIGEDEESRYVAVEVAGNACQFDPVNDDKSDHFKTHSGLKVDSVPLNSTHAVCSSQQSDLDLYDAISPSPNAASNTRFLFHVKTKRESHQLDNTQTSIHADTADETIMADLRNVIPSCNSSPSGKNLPRHSLCHAAQTSEHHPKVKETDRSVKSHHKFRWHSSETDEDEDVKNGTDLRSSLPAKADTTIFSKLLVAEENADESSEDTESYQYSLQLDRPATRQHLMEKSNEWKNVEFYMNKIESVPRGAKIEDMLLHWKGDYGKLESHHGYIQWLFPIAERGMNTCAQPLSDKEAEYIKSSAVAKERMLRAYRMMLDFFGMNLKDEATGMLQRARNWRERVTHLNRSHHNYLRITRILKCFALVGLARLQAPFVKFLITETFANKTLSSCQQSCRTYWIPAVIDDGDRVYLVRFMKKLIEHY